MPFVTLALAALVQDPAPALCPSQTLASPTSKAGDRTGHALALHGDRLLVGAPEADDVWGGGGAALVWERATDGTWVEVARLVPPPITSPGNFGTAVALSSSHAALGMPGVFNSAPGGPTLWGEVDVFNVAGGGPVRVQNPGLETFTFGEAVALDGDLLAVGVPHVDTNPSPSVTADRGRVLLYERQLDDTWNLAQTLVPSSDFAQLQFGAALAFEGGRLFVGAPGDNFAGPQGSGSVYVFDDGAGGFAQAERLTASGLSTFAGFGTAVAAVGEYLVVGAPSHAGDGLAVLLRDTGTGFVEVDRLAPPAAFASSGLGAAVAIDAARVALGAPAASTPLEGGGAVVLCGYDATGFGPAATQLAPGGLDVDDAFGAALALDTDAVLIGRPEPAIPSQSGGGAVLGHRYVQTASFSACGDAIDLSTGGVQVLQVAAGAPFAGQLAWLLGSASGTSPGIPIHGLTIPLVFDAYTSIAVTHPNNAPLVESLVIADAHGGAELRVRLPENSDANLAGITVHHAAVLVDPTLGLVGWTSPAEPLTLAP